MAAAALSPESPQIVEHVTQSIAWTVFDTKWVPNSARFVALGNYARGTGTMQVFALEAGGRARKVLEAEKRAPFKCGTFGAFGADERRFATGDFDGRLMVWDLRDTEMPVYSVDAHPMSLVNAIDGGGGAGAPMGPPEIATCGRDGCVRVWDVRQREFPVVALEPAAAADGTRTAADCWAVALGNSFNDTERVVVAGYDNGDVKMYDLRMNMMRWETNVRNGVCSLEFDRRDIAMNKLLVTTLEGRFRVYDMRTFHPEQGFAHVAMAPYTSTVWAGRHLPQNRDVFATGGGNGALHLWRYSYPAQRARGLQDGFQVGVPGTVVAVADRTLSTQPIACIDWSRDRLGLLVCGAFDQCIRVCVVTKLQAL